MIFDALMLAAVTDEVDKTITGGRVERISQPSPLDLILRIYHAGAKHDLLLSCDPDQARVHFTAIRRDNPPQPPVFCMLLRKYLDGARLAAADMPSGLGERIFVLEFRAHDGETITLVAEIMGCHSNLILVNGSHTILGAAKHIGRDINRFREILPGVKYQRPPRQLGKISPLETYESADQTAHDEKSGAAWLVATFGGVSPLLAREAVARAKAPYTEQSLWYGLSETLSVLRVGDWAPIVWTDDHGTTLGAYPIALKSVSEKLQHRRDSISVAIDHASMSIERRDTFTQARDTLQAALHRMRKQRERDLEGYRTGVEERGARGRVSAKRGYRPGERPRHREGAGVGHVAGLLFGNARRDPNDRARPHPFHAGKRGALLQKGAQGAGQRCVA